MGWLAACSTEATLSLRMLMLPLPPSRQKEPSSLWTGAPQDSRWESTWDLQLWSQVEILPKSRELSACFPILLQLLKLGPDLTTSSTLCMLSERLFTGTLEKVWKKESSLRQEKTWRLLRRTMKRLEWTALKPKERLARNTKTDQRNLKHYWQIFIGDLLFDFVPINFHSNVKQ